MARIAIRRMPETAWHSGIQKVAYHPFPRIADYSKFEIEVPSNRVGCLIVMPRYVAGPYVHAESLQDGCAGILGHMDEHGASLCDMACGLGGKDIVHSLTLAHLTGKRLSCHWELGLVRF